MPRPETSKGISQFSPLATVRCNSHSIRLTACDWLIRSGFTGPRGQTRYPKPNCVCVCIFLFFVLRPPFACTCVAGGGGWLCRDATRHTATVCQAPRRQVYLGGAAPAPWHLVPRGGLQGPLHTPVRGLGQGDAEHTTTDDR